MDTEKERMLEEIMEKRGFVLDFHKVLIEEDIEFLKRYENLISHATAKERILDKKVKEFLFIAVLTALGADESHIVAHMKSAVRYGATKQEILEMLECIYPPCGTLRFMKGIEAFKEAFLNERQKYL